MLQPLQHDVPDGGETQRCEGVNQGDCHRNEWLLGSHRMLHLVLCDQVTTNLADAKQERGWG